MTILPVQDPALPAATPRKVSRKPTGADRLAYNPSTAYVLSVHAAAATYAR